MLPNASQLRAGCTGIVFGLFLTASIPAFAADRLAGERALMQGRIPEAVSSLREVLTANPSDGRAHMLLCRAFYAEEQVDQAVSECEAALRSLPQDSDAQDWMGRAYGLKADRSGPLTGFNLAKKVKASFEAAVNLNASSSEAIDDLGQYYLDAPGIVGGGLDKASALASRVQAKQPLRARRLQALIAEKNKDYGTAERELRTCVESSGGRSDTWLDLGSYYVRRKDPDKAVEAFRKAYASNRNKDGVMVAVATSLHSLHREPAFAERALQDYLAGGHMDDSAPSFKAHTLLAQMLAERGDKAGAKIELNKALALAPDYQPTRKALAEF